MRYEDGEVCRHDLNAVRHELLPPAQPAQGRPPAKRSKGGGTAAHAVSVEGAAGRSGQKGGGKRQNQQQGVPHQGVPHLGAGSKQAGGAAAEAAAARVGGGQPEPASGAAAAAGAAAAGGSGAAPRLPDPGDPEVEPLLVGAAAQHSLMPIVEVLLEVARWAGVPVVEVSGDLPLEWCRWGGAQCGGWFADRLAMQLP